MPPPRFSIRDIEQIPKPTGYHIVLTTDVPCHLFMRWTLEKPRTHKDPVLRRGVYFPEAVRFCFVEYRDNEQEEAGDTLTHTFIKLDWPVCQTRYFYFWGTVNGELSPSESPLFTKHRLAPPVPPPELMYQLNSIEPQLYTIAGNDIWNTFDSSHDCPPDATGALILVENTHMTADYRIALRKNGTTFEHYTPHFRNTISAVLVGFDQDRKWQAKAQIGTAFKLWLYAYTGRDVVFLDQPVDIMPTASNVYQTKDMSSVAPGAIILLTEIVAAESTIWNYSIRALGSTKELYQYGSHAWPFTALDAAGKIEVKHLDITKPGSRWKAIGYIKQDATTEPNPPPVPGIPLSTWTTKASGLAVPGAKFTFVEIVATAGTTTTALRKGHSILDLKRAADYHGWWISCLHYDATADYYKANAGTVFYILAETH